MSMALPVFLYQIVLEKEMRLIENMKINGLKMSNYYAVNYVFNLAFFMITASIFMFFGIKVFHIKIFAETSLSIQIFMLIGWGLA